MSKASQCTVGQTFHAPVVDCGVRGQCHCVNSNPLPELDVLGHRVGLHLALHLNVEDLQRLPSCRQKQQQLRDNRIPLNVMQQKLERRLTEHTSTNATVSQNLTTKVVLLLTDRVCLHNKVLLLTDSRIGQLSLLPSVGR